VADRRYIDFDAALAEADEQPVVVRYKGRDWQLYASLPAKPLMRLLRLQAEGRDDALSQAEMVRFMSEMVPPGVLDAWLDEGMTVDEMGRLLRAVVAVYRGGEEAGEAPRPATGRPPSSSTGKRSRPTSGASTKSTSRKRSTK
jgi:hypothetical protein